jgi:hypothetical protein
MVSAFHVMVSAYHVMVSAYHVMVSAFHVMVSAFHIKIGEHDFLTFLPMINRRFWSPYVFTLPELNG